MPGPRATRIIGVVLRLHTLRHEIARAFLRELAGRLSVDATSTWAYRSRSQRLRNGAGSLLRVSSDVVWRPTPLVSLLYLLQARTQSRLRYGVGELGSALAPPDVLRRQRALVVAAPIALTLAAAAVHARRRRATDAAQLASPSAEETPVAARV